MVRASHCKALYLRASASDVGIGQCNIDCAGTIVYMALDSRRLNVSQLNIYRTAGRPVRSHRSLNLDIIHTVQLLN
jgi:hypothetical protein